MKKDISDIAFTIVLAVFGVIFGCIILGLLIYYAAFVIELSKKCLVALPIGAVVLFFGALELLAMQKPFK